jgi:hypothetical protein
VIERIESCLQTRKLATEVVGRVLNQASGASEAGLHDMLHSALAAEPTLFEEGYYSPPPHGIGVLFGNTKDVSRLRYGSLRDKASWPRDDLRMTPETIGLVYVSPVDKKTGMIGDLGFTFYHGQDERIKAHLTKCLQVLTEIARQAKIGMKFNELFRLGQDIIAANGLDNHMTATYDPTGNDFGHTIPWSYEQPDETAQAAIAKGDIAELKDIIARQRKFINCKETFEIPPTCAFTIEARYQDNDPTLPNVHHHLIVAFRDGARDIISGFEPINGVIFDKFKEIKI